MAARGLWGQPDPHGESFGPRGSGAYPKDPVGETWTMPASKNRGLPNVPQGYVNEIGQAQSSAALRVERQMHLDKRAYFRWSPWKVRNTAIFGVLVPAAIFFAITNEIVRVLHSHIARPSNRSLTRRKTPTCGRATGSNAG